MLACRAWAWRSTLVTDSRTAKARADSCSAGRSGRSSVAFGVDAGGGQGPSGVGQFAAESFRAVSGDGGANLGQGRSCGVFDVVHLLLGPVGVDGIRRAASSDFSTMTERV